MLRHALNRLLLVPMVLTALILGGSLGLRAQARPGPQLTANGIVVQAGSPLPIYQFDRPAITTEGTASVAQRFGALLPPQQVPPVFEDRYRGLPRFTTPNTATQSLLSQFTATGGFYAYNVAQLGDDSLRDPRISAAGARLFACQFLIANNFTDRIGNLVRADNDSLQGVTIPNTGGCQDTSQFVATMIRGSGLSSAPGSSADPVQDLGVVVRVPVSLPSVQNTPSIPLGGPGGHISLLFRSTNPDDTGPSLDTDLPGLAAVAMPFFERSFTFLRSVPAVDPAQARDEAEQRVRALFPNATAVNVPTPALVYMVGEAGEPQRALEPMLQFQGASATVDGQLLILKDFALPAVEGGPGGFGPSVSITGPANASRFAPGALTTLAGSIGGGTAPYSYTWTLEDGTPLGPTGTLSAPGSVSTQARLPTGGKDGSPSAVTVLLRVEDAEGARREALVSLVPTVAPQLYLPLLRKGGAGQAVVAGAAPAATLAAVNYRFGSEMAADYAPFGTFNTGDLPGVPPDVNGLRSGLSAYGWGERFFWANSNAWERDWRECGLGGSDCTYGVDRADLVYYSGHGGPGGIFPSNVNHDSGFFDGANARFQNVRWAMFSACQTLRVSFTSAPDEPLRRWLNAFQGAHMLLGFNSNMGDVAFGGPLVDNMRIPTFFFGLVEMPWAQLSIRAAWVKTAFDMNAGKPAYVYATSASVNPADNKLPKGSDAPMARPLPVNRYHWVWWECADNDPKDGLCQF